MVKRLLIQQFHIKKFKMGLLDLGLKAIAGKKAPDIKKGIDVATSTYQTLKQQKAAQPKYDVATPEMIAATKASGVTGPQSMKDIVKGISTFEARDYADRLEKTRVEELKKQQISTPTAQNQQFQALLGKIREISQEKQEDRYVQDKTYLKFQQSEDFGYAPGEKDYSADFLFSKGKVDMGPGNILFQNTVDQIQNYDRFKHDVPALFNNLPLEKRQKYVNKALEEYAKEREEARGKAQKMKVSEIIHKYTPSSLESAREEEAAQLGEEAKEDISRSLTRGALGAVTFGMADVFGWNDALLGEEKVRAPANYKENLWIQETAEVAKVIAGATGIIGGTIAPYSAIAKGVQRVLYSIPKVGLVLSKAPVFVTSMFRNVGEETVEATIRKASGQEYGPIDFLMGIAAGEVFEGVNTKFFTKAENVFIKKELELGRSLTPEEAKETLMNMPVGLNKTFGDVFETKRLVYLKGQKGGGRVGIEIPAKPEVEVKLSEKGEKGISKVSKDLKEEVVSKKIIKDFEGVAEYDIKTVKKEGAKVAALRKEGLDEVRQMIRGEKEIPDDINPGMFYSNMKIYAEAIDDPVLKAEMLRELIMSPVVKKTSEAAQTLRFLQERDPHSAGSIMKTVLDRREKKAVMEALGVKEGEIENLKSEIAKLKKEMAQEIKTSIRGAGKRKSKVTFSEEGRKELNDFINSITC